KGFGLTLLKTKTFPF
ncbi:unnamed protein product, partial [Allacma fusca]